MTSRCRPTRAAVVDLLSTLVSIPSINPSLVPSGAGEGEIAQFIASWLENAGLEVELRDAAPGRPSVVGRVRGATPGRTLILNAHIDTVGVAGMDNPFVPRLEGDRLYGRGAYDMKGGLAAIMLAAGTLAGEHDFAGQVIVTAVADEEYASLGTGALLPDLRADAAIVTEPTGLRLCVAHKGFAWLRVETIGRAAHGSKPDLGVDAIVAMGPILTSLGGLAKDLNSKRSHPLLGAGSVHASLIEGGQEVSSYPERCVLQIERRTLPGETPGEIEREVADLVAEGANHDGPAEFTSNLFFWRDPFEVDPREAIVRVLAAEVDAVMGVAPEMYGDTPWMDAALFSAAGIPTVVFGPGGGGAHAAVEWSSLSEVETAAEILARTALAFGRGTTGA